MLGKCSVWRKTLWYKACCAQEVHTAPGYLLISQVGGLKEKFKSNPASYTHTTKNTCRSANTLACLWWQNHWQSLSNHVVIAYMYTLDIQWSDVWWFSLSLSPNTISLIGLVIADKTVQVLMTSFAMKNNSTASSLLLLLWELYGIWHYRK